MNIKIYTRIPDQYTKYTFQMGLQGRELSVAVSDFVTGIALPGTTIDLSGLQKGHQYGIYFLDSLRWSALFDHEDEGEPRYNYLAMNYFTSLPGVDWQVRGFLNIYRPNLDADPVMINVRGAKTEVTESEIISVEELEVGAKFTPILLERHPEFETTLKHTILALEENVRLNQLRLMLHLMPQIDALSKVLFAIVERDPDLKSAVIAELPQYSNYKAAVEEQNFLNVMGDDEALAALRSLRPRDLGILSDYLTRKAALEGSAS